ncbi:MAG: fumarylacetoacetate hydrolase family protein [Actinobacteria bacterium]|nr:fumarylacetoacetate hydrolase family protein [Actinomycetota bacterium]
MRLVNYEIGGRPPRAGVVRGEEIVDVWEALGEEPPGAPGLGGLVLTRGIDGVEEAASRAEPRVRLDDVRLHAPIRHPRKIVCLGLNYRQHAAEAGLDPPKSPTFFAKFQNALAAPGADVQLPAYSEKVDYEAEVALFVVDDCKDVAEEDATDHVLGYTLLNDLSARDYQFMTPQWMPGKVFDGSAPCGPAIVTPDEAGPPDAIEISLTLNGERMQSASTADLIHSIPAVVAYLSRLMTLQAGDLISTGTPAGVGSVREPRVWLKPGDECVIESPQLGRLETRLT